MRFVKLIIISCIILFVIATSIGLLFPSTVVVSRAIDITAPKDSVMLFVKNINTWKYWMQGVNDTTTKILNSKKAVLGNTTVEITNISDTMVTSTWSNKNNVQQNCTITLYHQENQPTTVCHWQFVQQIQWYPWERFASMMNDKILGTMMEKNLQLLKEVSENK